MRLELDIDAYQEAEAAGWDYAVSVGGCAYPTRPMRCSDFNVLATIHARADKAMRREAPQEGFKALADLRAFVLSMFPADKPAVDEWPISALLAVVNGWSAYFQHRQRQRHAREGKR